MDTITEAQIKEIVVAALAAERASAAVPSFYIEPEAHYKQHARIDRFLDLYESTSNTFIKVLIGLFVLGSLGAIAFGMGLHK